MASGGSAASSDEISRLKQDLEMLRQRIDGLEQRQRAGSTIAR